MDTPHISGYSRGEVMDTPNVSGHSKGEVKDTPNVSGYSRGELLEGQCEDTDPRETTAEGSRMDGQLNRTLSHSVNTQLHLLDSHNSAFPGRVIKIQPQEKEEKEMLKEKIKKLEARNQELLAKAMAMHQHSEDINDPLRLSAVLERYEMLRLREWEKVRSSISHGWTYEQGSRIIKKLFDTCEKDIQQRTADILKVLDMPSLNDTLTNSKQMIMMREIRNLFRQLYYQNYSTVYSKIVKEAAIQIRTEIQREFMQQCCQIYCLLLLQDPPVKAEWNTDRSLTRYLEHMDKEDAAFWKKPRLLWPIMKRGEEIIVKGVVWDKSSMP